MLKKIVNLSFFILSLFYLQQDFCSSAQSIEKEEELTKTYIEEQNKVKRIKKIIRIPVLVLLFFGIFYTTNRLQLSKSLKKWRSSLEGNFNRYSQKKNDDITEREGYHPMDMSLSSVEQEF